MAYSDICDEIKRLYQNDDYDGIIDLIAKEDEVDYDSAVELARAHINKANTLTDRSLAYSLYENASEILDSYATKGKNDARYLYYKAYVLMHINLVDEAIIRLERALRFISINDSKLLGQVNSLLAFCKKMTSAQSCKLSDDDLERLDVHVTKYFGSYDILESNYGVDIIDVKPTAKHDYHVIMTKGLSAFTLDVPDGFDVEANKRVELGIILPKKWDIQNNWPFALVHNFINAIRFNRTFVGFGFSVDNGKAFSDTTKFAGAMLTAFGEYDADAQDLILQDDSTVRLFQIIPLMPMEVAYRKSHSAKDLLDLFKLRHVVLSPLFEGRFDVCESFEVKQE